jgi:hypothetical protein
MSGVDATVIDAIGVGTIEDPQRIRSRLSRFQAEKQTLPVALLYCFGAFAVARVIWRRYPEAENGWIPGAAMGLFVSLALAVGVLMVEELWCWNVETMRVGTSHMSYRVNRLWWARHRFELFASGAIVFWLAGVKELGADRRRVG